MSARACPHCGCELEDDEAKRRSSRANRYWFGRVVKAYREIWSQGRVDAGLPPYTKEEIHSTLVRVFVGEVVGPLGHKEPAPTRIMDSKEFWQLTEAARHYALHKHGYFIPEPNQHVDDDAEEPVPA
jgi:hypothetical protein